VTVGTLALGAIALFVAFLPTLQERYRQPRLKIRFGTTEPHLRLVNEDYFHGDVLMRVEVANDGRRLDARETRIRVTEWWSRLNEPIERWVHKDIDPMALRWVSLPKGPSQFVEIPAKSHDFADLVTFSTTRVETSLCNPDDGERPFHLKCDLGYRTHRLEIVATASNAAAARTVVQFEVSQDDWIDNITESSPPPSDLIQEGGFVGILAQAKARQARARAQQTEEP